MTAETTLVDRIAWVQRRCADLIDNGELIIHGKTDVVRDAVICLLAEGRLVFANIVLGDEINRASPKTQSALLPWPNITRRLSQQLQPVLTLDDVRTMIEFAHESPTHHAQKPDTPRTKARHARG